MGVEISFGGVCRDIGLLPDDEQALRQFYDSFIAPAIWEDFSANVRMAGNAAPRAYDAELQTRGCEVGGSVSIKF